MANPRNRATLGRDLVAIKKKFISTHNVRNHYLIQGEGDQRDQNKERGSFGFVLFET